ncbi:MAG: hypothetical protein DRH12_06550 [Deltaproteobacteria bacterium]|nr:MAG: hypothetical protein DRH12_06550 [Deltaproteobacteria bacterium]
MLLLEFLNGPWDGVKIPFKNEVEIHPKERSGVIHYPYDPAFHPVQVRASPGGVTLKDLQEGTEISVGYGETVLDGNTYFVIRREGGGDGDES